MEIENPNKEDNLLGNNYFKILYPNQNYKSSLEYHNWRKTNEKNKGKNGKEILCQRDNIIIYQKKEDKNNGILCPICNKIIYKCKYCKKCGNLRKNNCCFRAFIKSNFKDKKLLDFLDIYSIQQNIIFAFIPAYFIYLFILGGMKVFYFNLEYKDGKINSESFFEKKSSIQVLMSAILKLYCILIVINYSIFFFIIYISIFILSLPFKLYPIKILLGILNSLS